MAQDGIRREYMPEINIKVRDKCAKGEGVIICNNSDYTVVWDLDEE